MTTLGNRQFANAAPLAVDDKVQLDTCRASFPIRVLDNDSDPDHDPLTVVAVAGASKGVVSIGSDGVLTYSVTPGQGTPPVCEASGGGDSFTYTIKDSFGATATATVRILPPAVVPPADGNRPPVARDDEASVLKGYGVDINVLANDSDPDGDRLRVVAVNHDNGYPADVSINADGSLRYQHHHGATGLDVFTYTVSGATPCPSASATVTVNIDHLPDPGVGQALSMCPEADDVDLFAQLGNQADQGGVWTDPTGAITGSSFDPSNGPAGDYTYTVSGTGACAGETLDAVIGITVFPSPDPLFVFQPDHGCTPLEVEFQLKNAGNIVTTEWTFGDGSTGSGLPGISHTYTVPGIISVQTHVTDANGCVATVVLHDIIHVYPPPSALFHYTPAPPLTTDATHVEFTAFQPELASYLWNIDQVERTGQVVAYDFPYDWAGVYPICLTVTDSIACTATLCDTIIIHDPLAVFVPNTFTPDGDGINDVWKPSLVSADPNDLRMEVYDRWGQVVFTSEALDMGWNGGKGNSGGVLPQTLFESHDQFVAKNYFNGGEFGLKGQIQRGRWALELTTKVALGNNRQMALVNIASPQDVQRMRVVATITSDGANEVPLMNEK